MQKKKGPPPDESDQAPPPRPPRPTLGKMQVASIVARNAVPLVGVLFFGHPAGNFVLLCVFNLCLTITGIGVVGVAVSQDGKYISNADRIAGFCTLALVGLGITAMLTALFGWTIALFIAYVEGGLFNLPLFWSALSILLCALPALWRQYDDDLRSKVPEVQRKQRDQPIIFIHALSAGLILIFCDYAFEFGRIGMIVAAITITAMFIFRDLHPELMLGLAPKPEQAGTPGRK